MSSGTRDRIVEAGVSLFRRQGYAGTGMKAIAAEARAPFGSIYHFFPGGKDDLSAEVIRAAGRVYGALVPAFFDGEPDVALATLRAFEGAAATVRDSGYADACPIATIALEVASTNESLRIATADVFQLWLDLLGERYTRAGLAPVVARRLAFSFVAGLEGGFILARAARDTAPILAAGDTLYRAVLAALAETDGKDLLMRTTLRVLLATLGAAAVLIALSILLTGATATAQAGERAFDALAGRHGPLSEPWPASMDNELRFYAALWGAYGVLLLLTARDLAARAAWVPWLAAVFFAGGVGRALSWASVGPPHPFFLALMATELSLPVLIVGLWLAGGRGLRPTAAHRAPTAP